MTNEEAFIKWRTDYESDYDKKPTYLEVWRAAISYMQEQGKLAEQCEPVAEVKLDYHGMKDITFNAHHWTHVLEVGDKLFTTQQRQQPLKRLSQLDVLKILNECAKSPYTNTQSSLGFADAIMNAMQEINK